MPLLKGRFDPKRFNAVTLAIELHKAEDGWIQFKNLSEANKQIAIDVCQQILDSLWNQGIIE